ncbi:transposase, MuDR, MULE transposase domain protein [Tanacetum coccineum]
MSSLKFKVFLVYEELEYGVLLPNDVSYSNLVRYVRKKFKVGDANQISLSSNIGSISLNIIDDDDIALMCLKEGYQCKVLKSCSERYSVECVQPDCYWYIFTRRIKKCTKWRITNINDNHACSKTQFNPYHRNVTSKLLSKLILPKVRDVTRVYRPKDIAHDVNMEWNIYVSYKKAWRRKHITLASSQGCPIESFAQLPFYCYNLKRENEGTVTNIETDDKGRFKTCFIGFGVAFIQLLAKRSFFFSTWKPLIHLLAHQQPADTINILLFQCVRGYLFSLREGVTTAVSHLPSPFAISQVAKDPSPMVDAGAVGFTRLWCLEVGSEKMVDVIKSFLCYMRPLIIIDAAHLKGTYLGTNLVAVGMDGNNQIIPIATGVSQGETGESWTWFLRKLKDCIGEVSNLAIISDRHYAITLACNIVFPNAFHGYCCCHLMMNYGMKSDKFKEIYWKTCKAYTPEDFEKLMSDIQGVRPDAHQKLVDARIEKWSRAKCPANRYNYMTSNSVESVNALTKCRYPKSPSLHHLNKK